MTMKKKKSTEKSEVIENSDNLPSTLFENAKIDIKALIRVIRGQQVMLDFDLAMLYGEKTSRLNEQVKRNIERFPNDFMFQLTKVEWSNLKTQIATSNTADFQQDTVLISQIAISKPIETRGGTQKQPYAFTRNGIAMLSSVLRSKTAIEGIMLIDNFVDDRVLSLLDKRNDNGHRSPQKILKCQNGISITQ